MVFLWNKVDLFIGFFLLKESGISHVFAANIKLFDESFEIILYFVGWNIKIKINVVRVVKNNIR